MAEPSGLPCPPLNVPCCFELYLDVCFQDLLKRMAAEPLHLTLPFLPQPHPLLFELLPSCNARRVSGCARRQAGGHHNGSRSRRLLRIIDSAKFVMEKDRTRDHGHGARAFLGRRCLLQLVLNGSSRCRISLELSTKHQCFRISQHTLTQTSLRNC